MRRCRSRGGWEKVNTEKWNGGSIKRERRRGGVCGAKELEGKKAGPSATRCALQITRDLSNVFQLSSARQFCTNFHILVYKCDAADSSGINQLSCPVPRAWCRDNDMKYIKGKRKEQVITCSQALFLAWLSDKKVLSIWQINLVRRS